MPKLLTALDAFLQEQAAARRAGSPRSEGASEIGSADLVCYSSAALMARILVVDDDDDVRELLELALGDQGHDVDRVDSGRSALERLVQHAYDLIVCDLHMPDRDGPAVHR